MDENNFIKNKTFFSFWDTWYFLIGNVGAFIKAVARYGISLGAVLLLGYKVQNTIMPAEFQSFDSLYCGFYATIVIHCMNEGIIPADVKTNYELNKNLISCIN